ncbi:MAG: nucleotide sugar dehydrogenase [Planctomycetota bacterium]
MVLTTQEQVTLTGDQAKALNKKIEDNSVVVAVIGLGYVGLPLAVEFASQSIHVIGIDNDPVKVEKINRGENYIPDVNDEALCRLVKEGMLKATTDYSSLSQVDTISICVPTPLSKLKDPDISYIVEATEQIVNTLKEGQLIVLESTTYPGTTEEVILPRLEASGLKVGKDFFLAFSPERVDPGNPEYNIKNTPKVVGGITSNCLQLSIKLYSKAIDTIVPVSSAQTAEMVKLLENTFRSVNIGLVNEMAIMSDKLGIEVWEVIEAASSKPYGFIPFYPGPGLGGHCIPIDPFYLSWKMKTLNYKARFIELAGEVNSSMPDHVVNKVRGALNEQRKSVNGARILILGVAYKRDVNDVRESPAIDIMRILHESGAEICFHDPYINKVRLNGDMLESRALNADLVSWADCVVIVADHTCFDIELVLKNARVVVDSRNATRGKESLGNVIKI